MDGKKKKVLRNAAPLLCRFLSELLTNLRKQARDDDDDDEEEDGEGGWLEHFDSSQLSPRSAESCRSRSQLQRYKVPPRFISGRWPSRGSHLNLSIINDNMIKANL